MMIPSLPSETVSYDIEISGSFFSELDGLDSMRSCDPHLTCLNDSDMGLSFDELSSPVDKRDTFDFGPHDIVDAILGLNFALDSDFDEEFYKNVISPAVAFGLAEVQSDDFDSSASDYYTSGASANASPTYNPDHDHSYSSKSSSSSSEAEKSSPPSVISESLSEASSSGKKDEVDVINKSRGRYPRQTLQHLPCRESPARNTRGRKSGIKSRRSVPPLTLKVPVQKSRVKGSRPSTSRQKVTPGSSPACSDDDSAKRKEHNHSERQRRRDQQNLLQNLRKCIPDLEKVERAPKVRILDTARRYIGELKEKETQLAIQRAHERNKHNQLSRKLRKLQKYALKTGMDKHKLKKLVKSSNLKL